MEWDARIARNAPEEAEVYAVRNPTDLDIDIGIFIAHVRVWWWLQQRGLLVCISLRQLANDPAKKQDQPEENAIRMFDWNDPAAVEV